MKMDPFIDTAIRAEQTVQNTARLRDTTLKALAQKAGWRISQTPLNVYTRYDKHGYHAKRIQIPADQADPYAISELVKYVCLDGHVRPVSREGLELSENVLLYDNIIDEPEGRIELR